MSHEKIAAEFDDWAETGAGDELESAHGDVASQVLAGLEVKPGERILDLGCGTGWATRLLARAAPGVQAIGIDVAPRMVKRAEELHSYTIRARYEISPFERLDFPDASFDRAFSMEALYYSPDLEAALAELQRVLKPGAPVDVIIDYYSDSPCTAAWAELMGLNLRRLSEAEWRAAFGRAGFARVETRRVQDSRGPGDPDAFEPDRWFPDWETRVSVHAEGSLWIHAEKAV